MLFFACGVVPYKMWIVTHTQMYVTHAILLNTMQSIHTYTKYRAFIAQFKSISLHFIHGHTHTHPLHIQKRIKNTEISRFIKNFSIYICRYLMQRTNFTDKWENVAIEFDILFEDIWRKWTFFTPWRKTIKRKSMNNQVLTVAHSYTNN